MYMHSLNPDDQKIPDFPGQLQPPDVPTVAEHFASVSEYILYNLFRVGHENLHFETALYGPHNGILNILFPHECGYQVCWPNCNVMDVAHMVERRSRCNTL